MDVEGVGVRVSFSSSLITDSYFYYIHLSGTPTVTDDYGSHGYYKLYLLESIQNKVDSAGWNIGWIIE